MKKLFTLVLLLLATVSFAQSDTDTVKKSHAVKHAKKVATKSAKVADKA